MHAHQFWWVWFVWFWRYCYFQKQPNFPFRPWTISKNLIHQNRLNKFMHVWVYVKCMHTNFGGRGLSSFGDIATFINSQISLSIMDYSPWSSKNLVNWNMLKKIMQVVVDVTCMYTNFGGCCHSGFGDIATLKNSQISLSDHGL